jgi:predicted metal-dependent hydrolase
MKKNIELHKRKVSYTLKISKKAKRLRLAVYCDGAFVVTSPRHLGQNIIEKFIIQKSQWILDKLDYFGGFAESFKVKNTTAAYLKYKERARKLVENKIIKFNKTYKFRYNKIAIKNQKTRWGSCSKRGNLNFNYKIVLLPEQLAEYVIVHELCHLGEFNHSRKFWKLVARALPNFTEIQNDLKRSGLRFL